MPTACSPMVGLKAHTRKKKFLGKIYDLRKIGKVEEISKLYRIIT